MSKTKPGGRAEMKSVEKEFVTFGGDVRLLGRLINHPALEVIHQLHQEESEKTKAAFLLTELNQKLNEYRKYAHQLTKISTLTGKAKKWLKVLNKTTLEVFMEKSLYERWKRTGNLMSLPDRYFYAGFLVPYTASLGNAKDKHVPKWSWIERWLAETVKAPVGDLRVWWRKEVINRKTWPPKTLLYALSSGAAVYFELKNGRKVKWPVEWSAVRPTLVKASLPHPRPLKRQPDTHDQIYLESVFRWGPLVRKNFLGIYPQLSGVALDSPDRLAKILEEEGARQKESWPLRQKVLINKLADREIFDIKAEGEKIRKKLLEGTPLHWRKILQKKMKESLRKASLKNGDGL